MALLLLFLLLLVAPQQTSATAPFDTHQLVEAKLNASMVDRIIRGFPDVELWQVAPAEPPSALARNATVQPPLNAQFFAAAPDLAELSARFPRELSSRKILSGQGQLGAWWESERLRMEARIAARPLTNASAPEAFEEFFEDYRPYDEIEAYMDLILLEYPEIATPFTLELPTREGRTMRGIRFGVGEEVKPAFYLQGSAHANEWLGTMAAMWAVVQLAEGYRAGDEQIVRLVEGLTIWCVPVLNVDGYLHTWTPGGRNWRKNRRDNGDGSFGVDLNRNNGPASTWCSAGSSTNPSSNTYCGPEVFSEPEDRAMTEFLASRQSRLGEPVRAAVDLHTFGSLLLYPWQVTYEPLPPAEEEMFIALGDAQEAAINAVNGGNFRNIQGVDLYPHSGGFIDCVWELHSVLGFTYEGSGNSHVQPAANILPSSREQWAGILVAMEYVLQVWGNADAGADALPEH